MKKLRFQNNVSSIYRMALATAVLTIAITAFSSRRIEAQSMAFLPDGVFSFTVNAFSDSVGEVINSGGANEPLLQNLLTRNSIATTAITGTLSYSSTEVALEANYGLTESINLGLRIPFITITRSGTITLVDATYSSFFGNLSNARYSGIGGIQLWGIWRPLYDDRLDLRVGATLSSASADVNLNPDNMSSLHTGNSEVTLFIDFFIYAYKTRLMGEIQIEGVIPLSKNVTDLNSQNVAFSKGGGYIITGVIGTSVGALGFGGDVTLEQFGETTFGNTGQDDDYSKWSIGLYANFGNLNQLESSQVDHPWEIEAEYRTAVYGRNAPETSTFTLGFSYYF